MANIEEPYIVTVDKLRTSANRDSRPFDGSISISQDRVLVASYLIGTHYTSMIAIWVEQDVPEVDKMLFISNYVPHIDGFLQVVLANLDSRCTASVKLAYSLIQQHQTTIPMQKEPCLGKGVLTGVLLSIFLVEFWRRSVYERSDTLPFPDNPGFIHRLFLDRAIKKRPDINDWIEKRKYLSTLPLSALLEDLSDVLKEL